MPATQQAADVGLDNGAAGASKLPAVTGLRCLAAFLVFAGHARGLSIFDNRAVQDGYDRIFENTGTLAVSSFFVLSGFVLTWSTKVGGITRIFYRRRFFKMFPNHVVVFAVALGLLIVSGGPVKLVPALANLLLVHAWIPDFSLSFTFNAVNGPTWSLSVEWALCLTFPLLILLVRRIRPGHLWNWAIGISALALLMPLISQSFLPAQPRYPYVADMSMADMWFLYFGPPAWMAAFVVGMILARIVQTGRWIGVGVSAAVLLLIGVFITARFLPTSYGLTVLYPLPLSMLFAAVAVSDIEGRRTWLGSKPMVWLGDTSYAFFLIHLTLLYTLYHAFSQKLVGAAGTYVGLAWGPLGGFAFLAGVMLLCVFLSWLLYSLVERPMMRRWSRPNAAPRAGRRRREWQRGDADQRGEEGARGAAQEESAA
jgi:peptidoglycan/LPS O-acetylase OafA/YrhL